MFSKFAIEFPGFLYRTASTVFRNVAFPYPDKFVAGTAGLNKICAWLLDVIISPFLSFKSRFRSRNWCRTFVSKRFNCFEPLRSSFFGLIPVNFHMLRTSRYYQIFYSIINSVTIYVMNNLPFLKRSFQELFHQISMLIDLIAIYGNKFMTMQKSSFSFFPYKTLVFSRFKKYFVVPCTKTSFLNMNRIFATFMYTSHTFIIGSLPYKSRIGLV